MIKINNVFILLNYYKVKELVATYKTLEDCRNSGGITPIKTS